MALKTAQDVLMNGLSGQNGREKSSRCPHEPVKRTKSRRNPLKMSS